MEGHQWLIPVYSYTEGARPSSSLRWPQDARACMTQYLPTQFKLHSEKSTPNPFKLAVLTRGRGPLQWAVPQDVGVSELESQGFVLLHLPTKTVLQGCNHTIIGVIKVVK
jgi:hypothetical protein